MTAEEENEKRNIIVFYNTSKHITLEHGPLLMLCPINFIIFVTSFHNAKTQVMQADGCWRQVEVWYKFAY
jgi:hypothetical protein